MDAAEALFLDGAFEDLRVGVADGDQFDVRRVLGDGAKVVGGDAPAADEGQADFAVGDGGHSGLSHGFTRMDTDK